MRLSTLARLLVAVVAVAGLGGEGRGQQFWRTDGTSGTWTGNNWSNTGGSPFNDAWVSGSNAVFNANSTVTFATTTVGNVTVADGITVAVTPNNTLSTGGAARTYNVGTGSTLNWASQSQSLKLG
jgi:hypothetical protein